MLDNFRFLSIYQLSNSWIDVAIFGQCVAKPIAETRLIIPNFQIKISLAPADACAKPKFHRFFPHHSFCSESHSFFGRAQLKTHIFFCVDKKNQEIHFR